MSARGGFRWRSAYTVDGATVTRPVEGHARLGAALVLPDALVLAASLDGSWAGSEEHLIGLGLNLAVPLGESWRCLASVTTTLPIDGLAANQPLGLGLAMTLVYAGW
ncbi:MAG: hypothetical protein U1F43_19555 [Myxococcota bacterium]